jgi:glycosyltransferase involved in cell wall biosynthesis
MRIAINCRSILKPRFTGIGRTTYHLLDWLGRIDQENEYILYCQKRFFDFKRKLPSFVYSNFTIKQDSFGLGPWSSVGRHDIYHIPNPDAIPDHPAPIVVTVHDLVYKTWPQSHTQETIDLTETYMAGIAKKASKIICVSESTRRDLHKFFNIPHEKSAVVYNGVDSNIFYHLSEELKAEARVVLAEKGTQGSFILSVGTLEPRKNLPNVLKALAILKEQNRFAGKLVVIGMKGWMLQQIETLTNELGLRNDVQFLGYVSDRELCYYYNLAEAFVYPSFYEGFGFPIIEAFCCGCPVVTSNVSSCPEVAGGAAELVDPNNPESIAKAVAAIVNDRGHQEDLRRRGLLRASDFSFQKTAQQTLAAYNSIRM